MAVEGQVVPWARRQNEASDNLRHALAMMSLAIPLGTMSAEKLNELMRALDEYIEAKLQPKRY